MRYCFFGLNPGGMTKYPAGIARELALRDEEAHFVFVVDDRSGLDGVDFPARSEFVDRGPPTAAFIQDAVASWAPDALITTAQRIPDSAYVSAAKAQGVFTAMFQHGLYLPFMKREASLFVRKAAKTWSYVRYAAALAQMHGKAKRRYVTELGKVFVLGKPYREAEIDRDRLNVDLVLLNGEHWRGFHSRQFGYSDDSQIVVGYPDYDQLPAIEAQPVAPGVCYVAQTLVEHGRLAEETFRDFLRQLARATRGRELIVKLHPASDLALYDELSAEEGVTLTRERLPRTTHYVGHYSTYLALVPFLSRNLFLWEFEGHPIPDSIEPAAAGIGSELGKLEDFVSSTDSGEPTEASIDSWQQVFFRGSKTSFETAAEELLQRLG